MQNDDEFIIPFTSASCRDISTVGGKGANLAILADAGLAVPPGFCVSTYAYGAFAAGAGLERHVADMLGALDDDAAHLDARTAELRDFIVSAPLPDAIAGGIVAAYKAMESDAFVAVRSSGTAEDLAGASFAGLHDTYLDVRGDQALLDAVRRCWASMWTARATSYRRSRGFDQSSVMIAVVVQQMVESDVSGVLFTANPLTAVTDEIVVNASYGLGEALVSGIATPDEHVLAHDTLRVKEQRIGAKEVRIVRHHSAGLGTVTETVPSEARGRYALSDKQVSELGELGKRVQALYQGFPQDIEWAIADDKLFLLQARPITGVQFSWDEELENWQSMPDDDDTLWTRAWADDLWCGAISPLTYSLWGVRYTEGYYGDAELWGIKGGIKARAWKYFKGVAYFNTGVQKLLAERTALPAFREGMLALASPADKEEIVNAPLSFFTYLMTYVRLFLFARPTNGPYKYLRVVRDYLENRVDEANGVGREPPEELADNELMLEFEYWRDLENKFNRDGWSGWFIYARDMIGLFEIVLSKWYDGDNPMIFTDLLTGMPHRTATSTENFILWQLGKMIKESPVLSNAFESAGLDYLEAFEKLPEGREFLRVYEPFLKENGHRGQADRDHFYKRRSEDVSIDYQNFKLMLSATSASDPEERERQVNERQKAAVADVEAHLRRKSFGALRVMIFRHLLDYVFKFFMQRDDQRHFFDRYSMLLKRCALEMGRRLVKRGVLANDEDVFFVDRHTLLAMFKGAEVDPLLSHKIAGRRHYHQLMLNKESNLPYYLRRNKGVQFATEGEQDEGTNLQGSGTSRGLVTARARIVKVLEEIGRVGEGEILVTQSTDPGWTPVFNLLKGIVLETGGLLAHGSCLAREYGLPAVQLADATTRIPDGALITVNGDTGGVLVHEDLD